MSDVLTFDSILSPDDKWRWAAPANSWHPGYTMQPSKTAPTGYILHLGDPSSSDTMTIASAVAQSREKGVVSLAGSITGDGSARQVPVELDEGFLHDRYYFNLPALGGERCKIRTDSDDNAVIVNKATGRTLGWGDEHRWHVYENLGSDAIDQVAACLLATVLIDGFFISKSMTAAAGGGAGGSSLEALNNGVQLTNNLVTLANNV